MKILLDECTPHVLKRLLTGFDITTVQDLGWTGIKNGALLQLAEQHFDVLITSDQNLKYPTESCQSRTGLCSIAD
jgi:predicted nuclease of predicted toxin-antitoxin system